MTFALELIWHAFRYQFIPNWSVLESVLTARHLGLILTQCSTLWLFDIMQPTLTQLCSVTFHCGHYFMINKLVECRTLWGEGEQAMHCGIELLCS